MRKIADILNSMGSETEFSEGVLRSNALVFWSSAVGSTLSEMSEPNGFRGDTLLVSARHPAVCMELRSREKGILQRINTLAGTVLFRRIVVKLSDFPPERLDKV